MKVTAAKQGSTLLVRVNGKDAGSVEKDKLFGGYTYRMVDGTESEGYDTEREAVAALVRTMG